MTYNCGHKGCDLCGARQCDHPSMVLELFSIGGVPYEMCDTCIRIAVKFTVYASQTLSVRIDLDKLCGKTHDL